MRDTHSPRNGKLAVLATVVFGVAVAGALIVLTERHGVSLWSRTLRDGWVTLSAMVLAGAALGLASATWLKRSTFGQALVWLISLGVAVTGATIIKRAISIHDTGLTIILCLPQFGIEAGVKNLTRRLAGAGGHES